MNDLFVPLFKIGTISSVFYQISRVTERITALHPLNSNDNKIIEFSRRFFLYLENYLLSDKITQIHAVIDLI